MTIYIPVFISVAIFIISCGTDKIHKSSFIQNRNHADLNATSHANSPFKEIASLSFNLNSSPQKSIKHLDFSVNMNIENPWEWHHELDASLQDIGCATLQVSETSSSNREAYIDIQFVGFQGVFHPDRNLTIYLNDEKQKINTPLILKKFKAEELKNLQMDLCLGLDARDMPAQSYPGSIVIRYFEAPCPPEGCTTPLACDQEPRPTYRQITCHKQNPEKVYLGERVRLPFALNSNIHITNKNATSRSLFLGLLAKDLENSAHLFQAPESLEETEILNIMGKNSQGKMIKCPLELLTIKDPNKPKTPYYHGLTMNLYQLEQDEQDEKKAVDFAELEPQFSVNAMEIDLPKKYWIHGYKGYKSQKDWVGLSLEGEICIPETGHYNFQMQLDDKGEFFLNDQALITLNDHTPHQIGTVSQELSAGWHPIKIYYYQGPRYKINLLLEWKTPNLNSNTFLPIPHHYFRLKTP